MSEPFALTRFQTKQALVTDPRASTGSREEDASKIHVSEAALDRRLFLVCCRGLVAVKAAQAARSLWTRPLFRLRAY